jgi:hypothetical protein
MKEKGLSGFPGRFTRNRLLGLCLLSHPHAIAQDYKATVVPPGGTFEQTENADAERSLSPTNLQLVGVV